MAMATRKNTALARKRALKELSNGQWKKDFDATYKKYLIEKDPQIKESLFTCLELSALRWGIWNFPELKEYAKRKISILKFMRKWKGGGTSV